MDQKKDGPKNGPIKEKTIEIIKETIKEVSKKSDLDKIQDLESTIKLMKEEKNNSVGYNDDIDWKSAYNELDEKFQDWMEKHDKIIEDAKKKMEVDKKEDIRILMKEKIDALIAVSDERDRYFKRAEYLEEKYEPLIK